MNFYIDPPLWRAHGRLWSHFIVDTTFDDLHDAADELGLSPRLFDRDHYDVPHERWDHVVQWGALVVRPRQLIVVLEQSGLRRPKRRPTGFHTP